MAALARIREGAMRDRKVEGVGSVTNGCIGKNQGGCDTSMRDRKVEGVGSVTYGCIGKNQGGCYEG